MENEHPASMTARAMKKVLPDRAIVTRDARVMMNTATSMFTLYLSTIAHDISTKNKRSTITLKDVLTALKETEFEHFLEPVEQCLMDTKAADARKRAQKDAQKAGIAADGEQANDADGGLESRAVGDATDEQIERPMDTDADLDGEQTIDEDEEGLEEVEEEEEDAQDDDVMEDTVVSTVMVSSPISKLGDEVENVTEALEDTTMEETKGMNE